MPIEMNDSLRIMAGKPSESKYFNLENKSYDSTEEALFQIPMGERHPGLTVYIGGVEYWFNDECSELTPKIPNTGIISVTYPELLNLYNNGGLITGATYLLTDYQTTYIQPVTNIFTVSDIIEPLILTAVTPRKLNAVCASTIYPRDIVFYNIEDNTEGFTKGKIYRRIDTVFNNDIGTDFRHIFYRRWKINSGAEWIVGNSYLQGNVVASGEFTFVCISANHSLNNFTYGWIQLPGKQSICTSISPDGYSLKIDGVEFIIPCTTDFVDYLTLNSGYSDYNTDIVIKSQTLDNNVIIGAENSNLSFEIGNIGWTIIMGSRDCRVGAWNNSCILGENTRHLIIGETNTRLSLTENNENIKIGNANIYLFIDAAIRDLKIGDGNTNFIFSVSTSGSIVSNGVDGSNKKVFNKHTKHYCGLVSQTGTNTPVIAILNDDINGIVLSRLAVGTYAFTKAGAFTTGKTIPNKQEDYIDSSGNLFQMIPTSADVMTLKTYAAANTSVLADSVLVNQFIDIEIFS